MSGFPSSIGGLGGHGHGGDRDLWIERLPSPPPTPAPPEASLTTQERLRLAKRRRAAQLKRWTQRDMAKGASAAGAPDIIQGRTRSGHSVETKLDMYQRVSWNISWQKGCPLGARDRTMTSRSAAAATGTVVHNRWSVAACRVMSPYSALTRFFCHSSGCCWRFRELEICARNRLMMSGD